MILFDYSATSQSPLSDDAVTDGSVINIPNTVTQQIVSASVGLVVNSSRISDYTFTLVSPTGQRVLLMENRGGYSTNGAGLTFVYTNTLNSTANGGAAGNTNYLKVDPNGSSFPITWNFFSAGSDDGLCQRATLLILILMAHFCFITQDLQIIRLLPAVVTFR